tara:strand:+ start:5168 stop:5968 length:801 start_codon:yes stop_codon:yes gene_type:complete
MKADELKIYVTTSNKYVHILKIFSYLFNKHWGPEKEVTVLGFDRHPEFDLPSNFNFISLGKQNPPGSWVLSDDVTQMLTDVIHDDYFIWLEENEFLIRPVNKAILNEYDVHINPNLARVDLTRGTSGRAHSVIKQTPEYDIICADQDAELKICVRASIWNREYLLNINQQPGTGVHSYHWEAHLSNLAKNHDSKVISSNKNWAITNMDGVHYRTGQHITDLACVGLSSKMNRDSSYGVKVEDETISELVDLGYVRLRSDGLYDILE